MPITILCPQCSAKYSLRRERVALGIKRALCYCCHAEFDIEGAVLELLGMAPEVGTPSAQLTNAQPPTVAAEPDAPPPADVQVAELPDPEQTAFDSPQQSELASDEKPFEEPAIQANDLEADQPPPLDLPDSIGDFQPTAQTDAPEADTADDIASPLVQNAADDESSNAAAAMGEIGVEIESSDLIFDTEDTLPAQSGNETDPTDTLDLGADGERDTSAVPLEDGHETSADETEVGGVEDGDKLSGYIPIKDTPIDEDALDGLPTAIDYPDELSDAPMPALVQDAEAPSPQSAVQLSPCSDEEAEPSVQAAAIKESETDTAAEAKEPRFDVGDFLDATKPLADEETADSIPVSLSEDDSGQPLGGPEAPKMDLQQEPSFTEELTLAGDAALPSNIESLDTPKSAEPADEAQPGIVPIAALTGEGLSALAGSGPSQFLDSLEEIAPTSETEPLTKTAPQLEKMPEPQADEPASSATNETAKIKVRMGDDLIENLTIEEVTTMVEDRRLQENHYIARQFSDNWIAAALVPALRPVFEKVRAEKVRFEVPPPPSTQGGKRGLFNGLFGRN